MAIKNCWDFIKCPQKIRDACDVFLYGYGSECWRVPKPSRKKKQQKKRSCIHCKWYIKKYHENR